MEEKAALLLMRLTTRKKLLKAIFSQFEEYDQIHIKSVSTPEEVPEATWNFKKESLMKE